MFNRVFFLRDRTPIVTTITSEYVTVVTFRFEEEGEGSANLVARRDHENIDRCNEIKVDKR